MSLSSQNRNHAYLMILDTLDQRKKEVFELIKKYPNSTAQKLAELTLRPINEITGRITELKRLFLLVETGSIQNRYTNKPNTAYRVVKSVNERINLINAEFIRLRTEKERLETDYHLANHAKIQNEKGEIIPAGFSDELKKRMKLQIQEVEAKIKALDQLSMQVSANHE